MLKARQAHCRIAKGCKGKTVKIKVLKDLYNQLHYMTLSLKKLQNFAEQKEILQNLVSSEHEYKDLAICTILLPF